MTYRTLHTIKTVIFMVIVATLLIVGLMSYQNKLFKNDEVAHINISAETQRLEHGTLYLPILNGHEKVSNIVNKKNEEFINFVKSGDLHSVNHNVTFVNGKVISIVWEGSYKGTANDIDGTENDVSYKVMDSVVINLETKKEMSMADIAKWVIEAKYLDEGKEIDINLNKVKDKSFDGYQNAYIENGDDKCPNMVLFWRNRLDLMKYNKQKMTGEELVNNLK